MIYDPPPLEGALLQGEILEDVWEHRALTTAPPEEGNVPLQSLLHPLAIVLTAVCDLEQDYNARFLEEAEPSENDPRLVAYVLLCDLFNENEIRSRIPPGSQFFKRVRQNQDARYHCLLEAEIRGRSRGLADRFLDFKAAFALPTAALYQGIRGSSISRVAVLPPIYIHDFMHRF